MKCCLQFDSGLYATAIVVDSAYKLAAASMSEAPMPEVAGSVFYHLNRSVIQLIQKIVNSRHTASQAL